MIGFTVLLSYCTVNTRILFYTRCLSIDDKFSAFVRCMSERKQHYAVWGMCLAQQFIYTNSLLQLVQLVLNTLRTSSQFCTPTRTIFRGFSRGRVHYQCHSARTYCSTFVFPSISPTVCSILFCSQYYSVDSRSEDSEVYIRKRTQEYSLPSHICLYVGPNNPYFCSDCKVWLGPLVSSRAGNSLISFPSESIIFCPKMSE